MFPGIGRQKEEKEEQKLEEKEKERGVGNERKKTEQSVF